MRDSNEIAPILWVLVLGMVLGLAVGLLLGAPVSLQP
jgi:hypothetical protein